MYILLVSFFFFTPLYSILGSSDLGGDHLNYLWKEHKSFTKTRYLRGEELGNQGAKTTFHRLTVLCF